MSVESARRALSGTELEQNWERKGRCDPHAEWLADRRSSLAMPATGQEKEACFPAETVVRTPLGYQPIATFHPGDRVLAFDQRARCVREARVRRLDVHRGRFPLLELRCGSQTVEVTPGHRFYDGTGWRAVEHFAQQAQAMNLRQNAVALQLRSGDRGVRRVYNLHIEALETYFVGTLDLLVRDY